MSVSLNFLVRIAGMLLLAYLGWQLGLSLSMHEDNFVDKDEKLATNLLMLSGAGLGLLTTHLLILEPINRLQRRARSAPIFEVLMVAGGVLVGLIFAVLLTVPLAQLPEPLSQYLPLLAAVIFSYLGGVIFSGRRREFYDALVKLRRRGKESTDRCYLLDTSTIIDGRLADVLSTGFLEGTIIVPRFVLHELHLLADSHDVQKRVRGKRGLEILNQMQRESPVPVEVSSDEVPQASTVDQKLIILAQQHDWPIITNDFNLNRVAALQHIRVLNLNQLADAVRLPVAAGDMLRVEIREEGREREQGIGYLEDGTMVVVEEARQLIGQMVSVIVSRVWQTDRGRMVFGRLANNDGRHQ